MYIAEDLPSLIEKNALDNASEELMLLSWDTVS